MLTKEQIFSEINQLPNSDLKEVHQFIEQLIKQNHQKITKNNVMAQLRQIKIEAEPDFSVKVEL